MTKKKINRITILTGAGFTASPEFFGITTQGLTDLIKKEKFKGVKIAGKTPGQYFYDILKDFYSNFETVGTKEELEAAVSGYVNFETILHFIEEIYTVIVPYQALIDNRQKEVKNTAKNIGMKPAAFYLKPEILTELSEAVVKYSKEIISIKGNKNPSKPNIRSFVRLIYLKFIELIAKQFEGKIVKENKGYEKFLAFMEKTFPANKNLWRWYSLNYDNWIKRHYTKINIDDGFVDDDEFLLFLHEIALNNHCHYNLHGCINWSVNNSKGIIKRKPNGSIFEYKDINFFSSYSISKDPLIFTPIISGYNKATRISYEPFLSFFNAFSYDVSNSDLMIVIGYGLGDQHINNLLQKRRPPILFIDYKTDNKQKSDFISRTSTLTKTQIKKLNLADDYINEDGCEYYYFKGVGDSFYSTADQIVKEIKRDHNLKFKASK